LPGRAIRVLPAPDRALAPSRAGGGRPASRSTIPRGANLRQRRRAPLVGRFETATPKIFPANRSSKIGFQEKFFFPNLRVSALAVPMNFSAP